ncbi:SDR family NAD(P)-dependent oxidoreductase [Planctomonas sp. JC2975]|uniref:SDR family NAD(P)-dependent oxidoreductase n=1 Tax=Planctomonas sp. JC2975 TaxID=2729626 RepID=UPI001474E9F0|nr:SDR family NAD(P)-dependent oxidoreductase [Planctomonas sp. JC2975]
MTAFTIPDQTGKTAVVTGANKGVGFFTAAALAAAGADVVLACRDTSRADAAARAIRARCAADGVTASVEILPLDIASLASVADAAEALASRHRIDIVVANAGMVHPPQHRETSVDGNEVVIATNLLGHFALLARLMPVLRRSPGARVVSLGSVVTRLSSFLVDDLQLERNYSSWRAYAQSKIAVESFGFELDRRMRRAELDASSVVAHPGYSISGRTPRIPGVNEPSRGTVFADSLQAPFTQSKERGARPVLAAATRADAPGGSYWGPRWRAKGDPSRQDPTATVADPAIARRVWSFAESATGIRFEV